VAARVRDLLGADDTDDTDDTAVAPDHDSSAAADRSQAASGSWWDTLRRRCAERWRLDPGRRAAIAVGLGVLVAALATGAWVLAERPRSVAVSTNSAVAASAVGSGIGAGPAATASSALAGLSSSAPAAKSSSAPAAVSSSAPGVAASTADEVVVDVAGKVRRPGLYRLTTGARIDDAVRAAGGALAGVNLASLNLAARVVDGQQIRVGLPGATPAASASVATGATDGNTDAASGPVNLNTATAEELQTLPGVGPVLAQHILDWRAAHGRFEAVDRLNDVPGIGEVKFAALRSRVTV
jgi:competence protein ComEA